MIPPYPSNIRKKNCQKLFCPRKEWGLTPGYQMRRKGNGHQQPPQLRAATGAGVWSLHSVLGSNSCSYCLAEALWDSLGTMGLTANSLTLLGWAWHDETQCAKAKSLFSQWQKCLYFLSWASKTAKVHRDVDGTRPQLREQSWSWPSVAWKRMQNGLKGVKLFNFFLSFSLSA